MMDFIKDISQTSEVDSKEMHMPKTPDAPIIPTNDELKERMEDVFPTESDNGLEHPMEGPEIPEEWDSNNGGKITLEDGTEVELPKSESPIIYNTATSDVSSSTGLEGEKDKIETRTANNGESKNTEVEEGIPNSTFEKDGITYKTDDNGNIYMSDGKLSPNSTYELNGSVYTTDDKGRITSCEAKPQRSPENPRDNDAQREAGGNNRKENDQGGHIVGRDLNGDSGGGNLVAMDSKINQSDYKRMENDVKTSLDEGKDVTTKTEITYDGDSERPDKITVTVTTDGKDTVYKFDNNIDNSLEEEVPESGKDAVQAELKDTGGNISSIKEEYDEAGNLTKTTVNITYSDEDGSTRRTKVVIENKSGGES